MKNIKKNWNPFLQKKIDTPHNMGEGKTEAENVRRLRKCLMGGKCEPPSDGSEKYQDRQGLRGLVGGVHVDSIDALYMSGPGS